MDDASSTTVRIGSTGRPGSELIKPPLVSIFVASWNYAEYISILIDSIRAQDYPRFEVVIFDNASTDDSRDVIALHVGADPRIRVVHGDQNYGQLGAFLRVFKEFHGEFVVSVDADDVLLPDFLSLHVQTHLALSIPVAFTSSNVFEIDGEGALRSGSRRSYASDVKGSTRGLRPAVTVPRLVSVSDERYEELGATVVSLPIQPASWRWAPGSSNMYRRSVLAMASPPWPEATVDLAIDATYNPFCHLIGSSALIGLPLSLYRIHSRNKFVGSVAMIGTNAGRPGWRNRIYKDRLVIIEFMLASAEALAESEGAERFWKNLDEIPALANMAAPAFFGRPQMIEIFGARYADLAKVFGHERTIAELVNRFAADQCRAILAGANAGTVRPDLDRILTELERAQPSAGAPAT